MEKEGHSSGIILQLGLLFAAVSGSPKVSELYNFTVRISSAIGMQRGQAKASELGNEWKIWCSEFAQGGNRTARSERMLKAGHVSRCPHG